MEARFSCDVCHDVIGVYEPVVVVGDSAERETSLAREHVRLQPGEVMVHAACSSHLTSRRSQGLDAADAGR